MLITMLTASTAAVPAIARHYGVYRMFATKRKPSFRNIKFREHSENVGSSYRDTNLPDEVIDRVCSEVDIDKTIFVDISSSSTAFSDILLRRGARHIITRPSCFKMYNRSRSERASDDVNIASRLHIYAAWAKKWGKDRVTVMPILDKTSLNTELTSPAVDRAEDLGLVSADDQHGRRNPFVVIGLMDNQAACVIDPRRNFSALVQSMVIGEGVHGFMNDADIRVAPNYCILPTADVNYFVWRAEHHMTLKAEDIDNWNSLRTQNMYPPLLDFVNESRNTSYINKLQKWGLGRSVTQWVKSRVHLSIALCVDLAVLSTPFSSSDVCPGGSQLLRSRYHTVYVDVPPVGGFCSRMSTNILSLYATMSIKRATPSNFLARLLGFGDIFDPSIYNYPCIDDIPLSKYRLLIDSLKAITSNK